MKSRLLSFRCTIPAKNWQAQTECRWAKMPGTSSRFEPVVDARNLGVWPDDCTVLALMVIYEDILQLLKRRNSETVDKL
jgi:hypothetical protein